MEGRAGPRARGRDALQAAGFDALPVPTLVVEVGPEYALLHANPAAARLLALDPADLEGPVDAHLPFDLGPLIARVLDGREVRREEVAVASAGDDDRPARWAVSLAPILDDEDGSVRAVVVCLDDVTGDALGRMAERAVLRELASAVASGPELGAVYTRVVDSAARTAHASCAALYLARGGTAFTLAAATDGADAPERFELGDVASDLWRVALGRTGLAWTPDTPPEGLPLAAQDGWRWGLAAGFAGRGRDLGLLVVGEPDEGGYADGALERLEIAATLSGTALANARLLGEQRDVERLLAGAVSTSAQLVEVMDPQAVQQRLLDGLVRRMGLDGAALWEPADEPEAAGPRPLMLAASAGLPEDVRARVESLPPASVAARLAEGIMPPEIAQAAISAAESSWPGHRVHLVALPAPATGVLGVYAQHRLPPLIGGVLATLAQAVAAAEQQATLHQRARTVVDSLQRELRPSGVDLPEGVEVGWVYRSATRGVEVGGDFYDVFATTSGHIGVACGDVSGKGVEAASLTAMAVHTLRAFALQGTSPQIVLSMLNGSVCRQTTVERFMTLAYARIDPADWSVAYALAGHPPPLVVGPSGVRVIDVEPDLPAGVDPTASFEERGLALGPGEALVLVTDGVTEARREGDTDGLLGVEGLAVALEGCATETAQGIADRIWEAVQEWTEGATTDDCAIIVVRRTDG